MIRALVFSFCVLVQPVSATEPISADALVSLYNARPLAKSGTQIVELELLRDSTITKQFRVQTSWQVEESGAINTLVMLKEPRPLAGTSYLLREAAHNDMTVHLHLPVGLRSVVELSQSEFGKGLLGSNFSYRDLRFRLPENGMTHSIKETGTMLGRDTVVLEVRPGPAQQAILGWQTAELHIATDPLFLLGADYYETGADTARKSLRVKDIAEIDGEWIATEMTMQMDDGHWSRISLLHVDYGTNAHGTKSFTPEGLPELGAKARADALAAHSGAD